MQPAPPPFRPAPILVPDRPALGGTMLDQPRLPGGDAEYFIEPAPLPPEPIDERGNLLTDWSTGRYREADPDSIFDQARVLGRSDRSVASREMMQRYYSLIIDGLGLSARDNPGSFSSATQPQPTSQSGSAGIGMFGWDRSRQEFAILQLAQERQRTDPNFMAGVPLDYEGFHAWMIEQEQGARRQARQRIDSSSGFGATMAMVGGFLVEGGSDPVNVATAPLGGGGRTIFQIAARSALASGIVELGQQPFIAMNRSTLGEQLALTEAAANVAVATAGGGIIGGGSAATGRVLGSAYDASIARVFEMMPASVQQRWAARMTLRGADGAEHPLSVAQFVNQLDDAEAAAFARQALGERATPDQLAHIALLERSGEIRNGSPYVRTAEADDVHAERLTDATRQLLDGEPVPLSAQWRRRLDDAGRARGRESGPSLRTDGGGSWRVISRPGAARDGGARVHKGYDIQPIGDPAWRPSQDFELRNPRAGRRQGLTIDVHLADGTKLTLMHLAELPRAGQYRAGEVAGIAGNTGNARTTPTHFHVEGSRGGHRIDPTDYFPAGGGGSRGTAAARPAPDSYAEVPFAQVRGEIVAREAPDHVGGYDAIAYNVSPTRNDAGVTPPRPVSQMTIGEVYDFQVGPMRTRTRGRRGADDAGSTGVGAYQFESGTLRENAELTFGANWREQPFNPANQDRIAETLWNRVRGNEAQLRNTWAAFANGRRPELSDGAPVRAADVGDDGAAARAEIERLRGEADRLGELAAPDRQGTADPIDGAIDALRGAARDLSEPELRPGLAEMFDRRAAEMARLAELDGDLPAGSAARLAAAAPEKRGAVQAELMLEARLSPEDLLELNWRRAREAGREPVPVWAVRSVGDGEMIAWNNNKAAAQRALQGQWEPERFELVRTKPSPAPAADMAGIPVDFVRRGDFYELDGKNAGGVTKALGVALTERNGVPMVGIPVHAADRYLKDLGAAGFDVRLPGQPPSRAAGPRAELLAGARTLPAPDPRSTPDAATLKAFDDLDGPGLQRLADSLEHDLLAELDAVDAGGPAFRLSEEGDALSARDLLDRLNDDLDAAAALRGCL